MKAIPSIFLGAGGVTAMYEYGDSIGAFVREGFRAITHHATRPSWERGESSGKGDNTSALVSEIESLRRMVRDSQNRSSVVVVSRGGVSWSLMTYTSMAAGVGYLYLRFVKGWRLADFFYVSQASLKASTEALKQGIDGLKDYTSKTKEFLQGRLQKLETGQADHMERTERIDERITVMHEDVDEMRGEIGEVGMNIQEVKGTLGDIQGAQQYNSQGIYLLLRVVSELVGTNNFSIRERHELDQFSKISPPLPAGTPVPGLESLRELSETTDRGQGGSGWGQKATPLPIAAAPTTPTYTPATSSENSGSSGHHAPRVLTRGGGGSSSARLFSSSKGVAGFGSTIQ